jgi:putative tryptophan/tyrosine transport system substrate-binding protein
MERRGSRVSRRAFVVGAGTAGLGLVAGCGRLPGQGQEPVKVPRLGYLTIGRRSSVPNAAQLIAFRQGLQELGYKDGQNIVIEPRWAEGEPERLPALAAELVELAPDVLIAGSGPATGALRDMTSAIPIIAALSGDLVEAGFAESLARPGGNVTGLSIPLAGLAGKRLQLLKETVPAATRVALPWNPASPAVAAQFRSVHSAAQVLGVELVSLEVRNAHPDLEIALETAAREGAQALITLDDAIMVSNFRQIQQFAATSRLPVVATDRRFVEAGGLMSYGASARDLYRRAAYYVDRILKGTKPADLPVEQPMTFEFVVNLKTARELGITFPNEIMLQVTEVIE